MYIYITIASLLLISVAVYAYYSYKSSPAPVDCVVKYTPDYQNCISRGVIVTPPANGGKDCPSLTGSIPAEQCLVKVDCVLDDWKYITNTCNQTRAVKIPAQNGGATCSTDINKTLSPPDCYTECQYQPDEPLPVIPSTANPIENKSIRVRRRINEFKFGTTPCPANNYLLTTTGNPIPQSAYRFFGVSAGVARRTPDNSAIEILSANDSTNPSFTFIFSENGNQPFKFMDKIQFDLENSDWKVFELWTRNGGALTRVETLVDPKIGTYPYTFETATAVVFKTRQGSVYNTTIVFKTIDYVSRKGDFFGFGFTLDRYPGTVRDLTTLSFTEQYRP